MSLDRSNQTRKYLLKDIERLEKELAVCETSYHEVLKGNLRLTREIARLREEIKRVISTAQSALDSPLILEESKECLECKQLNFMDQCHEVESETARRCREIAQERTLAGMCMRGGIVAESIVEQIEREFPDGVTLCNCPTWPFKAVLVDKNRNCKKCGGKVGI